MASSKRTTALAVITLLTILSATAHGQYTIVVGPNVLVSRDGDVAHVESHVAVSLRNPRNLLGTAITFTSPTVGTETKTYASFDGGWSWTDIYFPDQRQQGAWDPQVGFGVTGTAYLVSMVYTNDSTKYDVISFYRSEDGGRTWTKPLNMGFNYDRNALAVDTSFGRFRGRVYVISHGARGGIPGAQLFRSSDDGRTFLGPVSTRCKSVNYFFTLSDGTLWIPCGPGDFMTQGGSCTSYSGTTSSDGGQTVKPFIGSPIESEEVRILVPGSIVYAVDRTTNFRDRIYALWRQVQSKDNTTRIVLKYSTDKGRSWSGPRMVAPPKQNGAWQYLPMATVDRDGILGIIWFEALPPNFETYDLFFTASCDGGATFLPPRRVTSQPSISDSLQNRAITQIGGVRKKNEPIFFSAYSRWRWAGEYTGVTADNEGIFHAFWPDARRGAFQLYSSRISVERVPINAGPPQNNIETDVDQEVNVEFGPATTLGQGLDDVIFARLHNTSTKTIWGPFTVKVTAALSGLEGQPSKTIDPNIIFDPQTRQWSPKATIDYTPALRDIPFLAPGTASEAIEWRFRNASRGQLNLTTHVYAGASPRQ